jgi:hypothetical protein
LRSQKGRPKRRATASSDQPVGVEAHEHVEMVIRHRETAGRHGKDFRTFLRSMFDLELGRRRSFINPGLYTAAFGRHFGRPGNRFWPAFHGGGFTPRLFSPFEESHLLELKFGITNIVLV